MKQLHQKTQIEVQRLLDDTGHALTLDDLPDILELDELAHRITSTTGDFADICSWPVKCGNVLLKPLSVGKMLWYNSRALQWFKAAPESMTLVLAFLMASGNDEQFLDELSGPDEAKKTIERWGRKLKATPRQMAASVSSLLPFSSDSDHDQGNDYGPLIALLCREYGNTPDYWLYRCDINIIESLTAQYVRRINEEIRAANRASGRRSAAAPPVKTPSMESSLAFAKRINELRQRWSNVG